MPPPDPGGGNETARLHHALLSGGAAMWPLATHAQQLAMPVIGFLHGGSNQPAFAHQWGGFRKVSAKPATSRVRTRPLSIAGPKVKMSSRRWRADLVRRQVSVIATGGVTSISVTGRYELK